MAPFAPAIRFEKSAYYFAGFLVLAIIGFWPSYFSGVFQGHSDRAVYFHLHTVMVSLWLVLLIVQPLLISRRRLQLHRLLGRSSYVVFPLLLLSVLLLAHSRIPAHIVMVDNAPNVGQHLFIPFKDLLILCVAFFIAIQWRHVVAIHARGMVATGLVFIEPALVRLFRNVLGATDHFFPFSLLTLYLILVALMVAERRQQRGRWVFPLILGLYVIVHTIIIFHVQIGPWNRFATWFAALPLT